MTKVAQQAKPQNSPHADAAGERAATRQLKDDNSAAGAQYQRQSLLQRSPQNQVQQARQHMVQRSAISAALQQQTAPALQLLALPEAMQFAGDGDTHAIHAAAAEGMAGAGGALPFGAAIQRAFGRHDISQIQAHSGPSAERASQAMGARAYATGEHVVFAGAPDLHTAAHEAAHVVQQRGGVQLKGGVGQVGDAYEQHADQVADRVMQGQSAEALLDRYAGSGGTAAVQRDGVAVDILTSGAQFTWSYMSSLIQQSAMKQSLAQLLEDACLYLTRYAIKITNLSQYLEIINPYLATLKAIRSVILTIPEAIRTLLMYGVGWAINKFSVACMRGAITESHISTLLTGGSTALEILGKIIDFLDGLGNNTVQTIYSGIWTVAKAVGVTTASSISELAFGPSEPQVEEEDSAPSDSSEKPQMVDANLGWFWLHADQPQISTWKEKDQQRGGLQLDASFGAKLFGNVMGADKVVMRVPYGGGWNATFMDVSLVSSPIGLAGIFEGGPIRLQKLRVSNEGLQFAMLVVENLKFGDQVLTAERLEAVYRGSVSQLAFNARGAKLRMLGHTFEAGLGLTVGTDGEFIAGNLEIASPDRFELIKDKLVLTNPSIDGRFAKGAAPVLGVQGDLQLNLVKNLQMTSTRTRVAYNGDKGFEGSVGLLRLDVPVGAKSKLSFLLQEGLINKDGFKANKVQLIYAYGDQPPPKEGEQQQSQSTPPESTFANSDISSLIPGFNMDWLQAAGLETLVIDVGASDVSLGSDGFKMGELHKRVAKLKASLFGVGASFDGDTGQGALTGRFEYQPPIPSLDFHFPIVPGINGGVGLSASFLFAAEFGATLARQPVKEDAPQLTPWRLGSNVGLSATGSVEANAGLSAGIPMVASVHAELFAKALAELKAQAGVQGVVTFNNDTNAVSLSRAKGDEPKVSYDLSASLKAALGAQIRGKLLFIYEKKFWQYQFKEWELGTYRLKGEIIADESKGYSFVPQKQGFDSGLPSVPQIDFKVVTVFETVQGLESSGGKIKDKYMLWRLVHDLADPSTGLDHDKSQELFAKVKKLNATGEDPEAYARQTFSHISDRLNQETGQLSLLMTKAEWVQYSTTDGVFSVTSRKAIVPVDNVVDRYHRAVDPSAKLGILDELMVLAKKYMGESSSRRREMVAKLLADAEREKIRLQTLPTHQSD